MDQIILFGDSITQQSFDQERGYGAGAALSFAYVRKLDVVNRGCSGYNTDQALVVLPRIIPPQEHTKVRLLTVFFGANDSRLPNSPGPLQQHVPVERFAENLKAIVSHPCLQAHSNVRILLITVPPCDERMFLERDEKPQPGASQNVSTRRTAKNAALYAETVRKVGAETGVPVLDIWTAMMKRAGYEGGDLLPGSKEAPLNEVLRGFLMDGLHFSGAGYRVLFEELLNMVKRTWPELNPNKLPFTWPTWDNAKAWKDEGVELGPAL